MFSIVIPTWNNLDFLKLCVNSIRKNSQSEHEIIIHINDGSDGTLEWVQSQGIKYSHTAKNIGICLAVNHLVAQASHDWVLYMNDDMVACPGWDTAFAKAIESSDTDLALFFSTLIQADNGRNPNIIKNNFGSTPQNFDESRMLQEYLSEARDDVEGGEAQPTLFHRKWWTMVGGYSLEFSPGMSSDDDLLMKFWVAGCRHFRIVGLKPILSLLLHKHRAHPAQQGRTDICDEMGHHTEGVQATLLGIAALGRSNKACCPPPQNVSTYHAIRQISSCSLWLARGTPSARYRVMGRRARARTEARR